MFPWVLRPRSIEIGAFFEAFEAFSAILEAKRLSFVALARFEGIRSLQPHFRVTFYATTGVVRGSNPMHFGAVATFNTLKME